MAKILNKEQSNQLKLLINHTQKIKMAEMLNEIKAKMVESIERKTITQKKWLKNYNCF